jgi:drug/metabolite transporter (DMT)-like permease
MQTIFERVTARRLSADTWSGLANLLIVYVVWGSTYLAIRVAVQPGAGFPPFTLAATRTLVASLIMFALAALTRQRLRPTRSELGLAAASGLLLWVGGNGLVSWAEQRIPSALTALIIGATPLGVALVEAIVDRRLPSIKLALALLVGFAGIGLLSAPVLVNGVRADGLSILALITAALSWGAGSVLQSRRQGALPPLVSAGYQHLFGCLGLSLVVLLRGEPWPTPTPAAWLAWGYLVVVGSVISFTAYVRALRLLPTSLVATYAYVNPVIAVFLGWLILREAVTGWIIAGSALVLLGVAGVFRWRARRR